MRESVLSLKMRMYLLYFANFLSGPASVWKRKVFSACNRIVQKTGWMSLEFEDACCLIHLAGSIFLRKRIGIKDGSVMKGYSDLFSFEKRKKWFEWRRESLEKLVVFDGFFNVWMGICKQLYVFTLTTKQLWDQCVETRNWLIIGHCWTTILEAYRYPSLTITYPLLTIR